MDAKPRRPRAPRAGRPARPAAGAAAPGQEAAGADLDAATPPAVPLAEPVAVDLGGAPPPLEALTQPPPAPPPTGSSLDRFSAALLRPEALDSQLVRLGAVGLLALAAVVMFRGQALAPLATAVIATLVTLAALWMGFHRLGLRAIGGYWPGAGRGLLAALLLVALLPPGLPPALVAVLAAAAVVIEGRLRQAAMTLALGGVGAAWLVAWAWHARNGLPYLAAFDLRPLDDPVRLWSQFGIALDPTRLYAGNVAGPLGVTSFGLVAVATLALGYIGEVAWDYLAAFFAVLAVGALVIREPVSVAVFEGPALAFAAVLAAERRRLPHAPAFRAAAGAAAGLVAVVLARAGLGVDAYGVGVVAVAALLSVAQLVALADRPGREARPAAPGSSGAEAGALLLLPPLGWLLVGRDASLVGPERRRLVLVSSALFVACGVVALAWIFFLRLPR